jgi:hypothetical protein
MSESVTSFPLHGAVVKTFTKRTQIKYQANLFGKHFEVTLEKMWLENSETLC